MVQELIKFVGSFGDVNLEFYNDKIISTGGEGAMIGIKQTDLKIWAYKEIGKNFDKVKKFKNTSSGFNWVHDLGTI